MLHSDNKEWAATTHHDLMYVFLSEEYSLRVFCTLINNYYYI